MTIGFVLFVVTVLASLVVYSRWAHCRTGAARPSVSAAEEMAELAAGAEQAAQEAYGVALDFSEASVERVDAILARLHDENRRSPFFPQRMVREANRWGAYLGEVARRSRGGEWQRDSAHVGRNTYPLVFGEQDEIYPCAWCFRRITNGPEDNVAVKFRLSVTERPQAKGSAGTAS